MPLTVRCASNIRMSVQVNLPSLRPLSGLITQKTRRTHSPGLFQASTGFFLPVHPKLLRKSSRIILLPSRLYCRFRIPTGSAADDGSRTHPSHASGMYGFTAGRELHPTLKNVTFYVINYECGHLPRLSDYLYYHNRKFGAVNTLTFSEESPPAVLPEWKPQLLPPKQPALRLPPPAEAHPAHFSLPEQPPQNSP